MLAPAIFARCDTVRDNMDSVSKTEDFTLTAEVVAIRLWLA